MSTLLLALVLTQAGTWSNNPMAASGSPPAHVAPQAPAAVGPPADQWSGWDGRPSGIAARVDHAPTAGEASAPAREPVVAEPAPWLEHRPLPGFDPATVLAPEPEPHAEEEDWALPLASSPEAVPARAPAPETAEVPVAPIEPAAVPVAPAASPAAMPVPMPMAATEGGYQSARWGMSQAEVAQLFPEATKGDGAVMVMPSQVSGENSSTGFFFVDDRLVAVTVAFTDVPSKPAKYLSLFGGVKEALAKKYGAPASEQEDWAGDHYKLMDRGMALMMGGLRLASSWQTSDTGITLGCSGGEMKGRVQITYASLELAGLLRKEAERRQLQGL